LVQSEVTTIYQDNRSFLWIGTKCGINRFDGLEFKTIADTNGISASWIFFIEELNDSTVWFLTAKGCVLFTYGRQTAKIQSYFVDGHFIGYWTKDGKGYFANQTKSLFCVDHSGVKMVNNGFFDRIKGMFHENTWVDLTYSKHDGNFYFRNMDGELVCLRGNQTINLHVNSFNGLFKGVDGRIYFTTPDVTIRNVINEFSVRQLNRFSSRIKEPVRVYCVSDTTFSCIADLGTDLEILNDHLLVINPDSLFFSSPDKPFLRIFTNGEMQGYHLPFQATGDLFIDREQNLWAGSPMGLMKIYSLSFTGYDGLDGLYKNLQFVAGDKNNRIITGGFENGLQRLEYNDTFTGLPMPLFSNSKVLTQVYPGCGKDRYGNLYISVNPYCMITWDGARLRQIPDLPVTSAYSFFEDSVTGIQYIGTNPGLLVRRGALPGYRLLEIFPGDKGNKIVSIVKDDRGRLLLGGFKGLSFLEGDQITHLPTREFPFSQGANAMVRDHRGNIWIGNTTGLWLFNMSKFEKISNPWFNNLVVSLCLVDSAKLFIGGLYGIGFLDLSAFYNSDTVDIRYFNSDNGFTGKECQQNAVWYDKRNLLWVATTDNLQRIDVDHLPPAGTGPRVYLEKISRIDETMKLVPLLESSATSGQLHLDHHVRNLRFDYAAPVFRGPSFVRYRYILEGQDMQWSPPVTERYAVYTNLTPGSYIFKVIACNDAGVWSDEPAAFRIVIRPAFWQTWWFWLLVVLLLAAFFFFMGYLSVNRRRQRSQEKLEYEKRIAELQLISIRNQIDPHFTFNAMNSIASVILKEEKEKAYSFFVKLSAMIRQVLSSGEKVTRSLAEELEFVRNYLEIEKLRFRDTFQYTIHIIQPINLDQEVPKMVIQTYTENAIRHGLLNKKGGGGVLTVTVKEENEKLTIVVEDNGIGRKKAQEVGSRSTGKGLMILNFYYDFFDRYNEKKIVREVTDLYDDHHEPSGTRITVIIPSGFRFDYSANSGIVKRTQGFFIKKAKSQR